MSKIGNIFKRYPTWLIVIVVLLIIIRACLPAIGKWVINKQLDQKMGEYTGHIDDFDLSLYRGAYELQGLVMQKREGNLPPIIKVEQIDISISWRAMLKKMMTTDIKMTRPEINLIDSKEKEKKQFGAEEDKGAWNAVFDTIFPINIESFKIEDGAIHFANSDLAEQSLMINLTKVDFNIRDLRTRDKDTLSPFSFEGLLQEHAKMVAEGSVDILSKTPKVDMDFQLEKFHMNSINKLLLVYVPIDITRGDLSVYGEVASSGDAVGYVKVFLKDSNIHDPKQKYHGVKHFFIEIAGAIGRWIFENNKTNNIAAEIPFNLKNGKMDVNTSKAFWSALKNAGDSLPRKIDDKISLKNLGKESSTEQTKNPSAVDEKVPDKKIKGQHSGNKEAEANKPAKSEKKPKIVDEFKASKEKKAQK